MDRGSVVDGDPMSRAITLAGYAVLALAFVVLHRRGRPTFGEMLTALLQRPVTRWLLLAGWLWVGWHVFVRVDWQ